MKPLVKPVMLLNEVDISMCNCKPRTSKHDGISRDKLYLAKWDEMYLIGRFSEVWFGWKFHPFWGANSIQLDTFDKLWEIVQLPE